MDLINQLEAINKHKEDFSLDKINIRNAIYIAEMLEELGDNFELFVFDGGIQFEWEDDNWYIEIDLNCDNEISIYVEAITPIIRTIIESREILLDELIDWLCEFSIKNNITY